MTNTTTVKVAAISKASRRIQEWMEARATDNKEQPVIKLLSKNSGFDLTNECLSDQIQTQRQREKGKTMDQNPEDFDRCVECFDFDYLPASGLCSMCRQCHTPVVGCNHN